MTSHFLRHQGRQARKQAHEKMTGPRKDMVAIFSRGMAVRQRLLQIETFVAFVRHLFQAAPIPGRAAIIDEVADSVAAFDV